MIKQCKKCGSDNLILEPRIKGQDILNADMVALKCSKCGTWLKWCPKSDREFYFAKTTSQTREDEIKVYFNKLPLNCRECPCCYDFDFCRISKENWDVSGYGNADKGRHPNCPLKLIKDHNRELLGQVCEKIRCKAVHSKLGFMGQTKKGYYTIYAGVLEEIEKEYENDKTRI